MDRPRNADDLIFNAHAPDAETGRMLTAVRNIVGDEGSDHWDEGPACRVSARHEGVTGLAVNERPTVPHSLIRRIRLIRHHPELGRSAAQTRAGREHMAEWLRGILAYLED